MSEEQLTLNQREAKILTQLVRDRDDSQRRLIDGITIIAACHDLPDNWESQGYRLSSQPDGSFVFIQPAPPAENTDAA